MEQLLEKLQAANLIDDLGNIVLERYGNGFAQTVDLQTFSGFFGAVLNDTKIQDKYTALKKADAGRGYAIFFDTWEAAGIL